MPEGHRATAIYFRHLLLIRVEIENIVNTLAICRHTFYISSLSLPCNLNKLIIMENLQSNLFYSLAGVAAVASLASCTNKQKTTEQKPLNIVYIMTAATWKLRILTALRWMVYVLLKASLPIH